MADEKEETKEEEIETMEYTPAQEVETLPSKKSDALNKVKPIKYIVVPSLQDKIVSGVKKKTGEVSEGIKAWQAKKKAERQAQTQAPQQVQMQAQQPVRRFNRKTIQLVEGGMSAPSSSPLIRRNQMQFFEEQPQGKMAFIMGDQAQPKQMFGGFETGSNVFAKMGGLSGGSSILERMGGFGNKLQGKPKIARRIKGRPQRPQPTQLQKMMFGKPKKGKSRWF